MHKSILFMALSLATLHGIACSDAGDDETSQTAAAWKHNCPSTGSSSSSSTSTSTSSTSSGATGSGGASSSTGATTSSSAASSSASTGSGGGSGGTGKWVSGYYVTYEQSWYPPNVIDWNGLTHLIIGRVVPNANGSLNTNFDLDPNSGPMLAKSLASLAHQNGRKAVVMLGGAGAHDGFVGAASAQNRATFVQNLVALATDYGFDGFDIDWEPLPASDHADFHALAQALRSAMPAAVLTVPVGWVSANAPGADAFYGTIAPVFDQINIMSYTMADAWPGWQSWHSSALNGDTPSTPSSVDASVDAYLAAGVPAAKLGIGIGFAGACWSAPVNAPLQSTGGSHVVAQDHVMTFDHVMSAYYSAAAHHWDATAQVPYLGFSSAHGPEGCTFVSYDDPQSIVAKGDYVKQQGLGGTIVWTINQGYRPGEPAGQKDPLMEALGQGFLQ